MKLTLGTFFTIKLLVVTMCLSAQQNKFNLFSKEDLIADLRLAMEILKSQHPHPYKYIDSASYERATDSLLKKMTEQKDVSACSQFLPFGIIKDVGTNFVYSADAALEMYRNTKFFPFPVIIERGRIFINIKGEVIPFGSEIIMINDKSAEQILSALALSTYSDGSITTGADKLSYEFQTKFGMMEDAPIFNVVFKIPGRRSTKKISLPFAEAARGHAMRSKAVLPVNLLQRSYNVYAEFNDETKTGILSTYSFSNQLPNTYKEYSDFFKEINKRNYQSVVIDLRHNSTGNPDMAALLYSFVADSNFSNIYDYRTKSTILGYNEYIVSGDGTPVTEEQIKSNQMYMTNGFKEDRATGFFIGDDQLKEGHLDNFPPDSNAFKGKLYVLTGGATINAAAYFALLVKKNKRGEIIGKETGSGENSTSAAWLKPYVLPKTKSSFTIPVAELNYFKSTIDTGRGVMPDKEVPFDKFVEYMIGSQDPEMTYTFDLIKSTTK